MREEGALMVDKKLNPSWWDIKNGELVLTPNAPSWLVKEMELYERKEKEFKAKIENYIVYDGPGLDMKHPVIDRLSDEEINYVAELLFRTPNNT